MFTVKENTTLVGVSELRKGIDKILEKARKGLVVISKRNKPQAVLMSSEEYQNIMEVMDTAEDVVLVFIAYQRYKNSTESDYIDIESLL
ncbi:MAG: type II toxin-antitoxin system Phd/YefM family antitoxin [bacterium]